MVQNHLYIRNFFSGDWFVGKDHFFAVANTKESRKDEKYRCMLKNRDDDYFLGVSITPECNTLKTVEKSPERMRLKPVRSNIVEHSCLLPENFTGTNNLFVTSKNEFTNLQNLGEIIGELI